MCDGNFTYIAGWLDSIALKRIVSSALKNAEIDFYDLPEGVRVRTNSEERFWFNYSSKPQQTPVKKLRAGEVFIEQFKRT